MTVLSDVLSSPIAGRLGWMLLHSVWQFTCIAVVLWAALAVLRRRSANVRYLAACLALLATLASSVVTFHLVSEVAAPRVSLTVAGKPGEPGDAVVAESAECEAIDCPREDLCEGPRAALPAVPPSDSQQQPVSRLPLAERPEFVGDGGSALRLAEADVTDEATAAAMPDTISGVVTPWLPWVSLVWISGVILLSLRHLGGWIGVQRLRRVGTRPVSGELANLVRTLSVRMKISRPVRVLQSTLVEIPIVAGWLRPVILLPASLITGLSASQLEAILAHELAHVRRHDYLMNLLQTVAETLLFYHPGVWWISRQIRLERENCCDDAAVRVCGGNTVLAEALTKIEASRLAVEPALAATGNRLGFTLRRVRRLLDPKAARGGHSQAAAAVLALALLGIVLTSGLATLATAGGSPERIETEANQDDTPSSTWGPAVEGVQVRLKANKSVVKYGQTPILTVDVRNQGTSDTPFDESKRDLFHLQVDGRWYRLFYSKDLNRWGIKTKVLSAGESYEGVRIACAGHWLSMPGSKVGGAPAGYLRTFGEGGHILRVAYLDSDHKRVESHPVRIDVVHPLFDPATGSDQKRIGERFSPEDVAAYHKELTGETLPAERLRELYLNIAMVYRAKAYHGDSLDKRLEAIQGYTDEVLAESREDSMPYVFAAGVERALAFGQDEAVELKLYACLRTAWYFSNPARAAEARLAYLRCLLKYHDLPATAPETPVGAPFPGASFTTKEQREEFERFQGVLKQHRATIRLLNTRNSYTQDTVGGYRLHLERVDKSLVPEALEDFREMVVRYLGDETVARQFVEAVKGNGPVPAVTRTKASDSKEATTNWGEPVEGVQCRLEPEKVRWAADEVPKLTAYVRDLGKSGLWLVNPPEAGARLQVDGQWYRWGGVLEWTGPTHSPCDQRGPFAFTLTGDWQRTSDKSPLKLSPGKHSVRFAYEAYRRATGTPDTDPKEPLLLISNPVDIEILPAEEAAWGEPADGVQCRLRPDKVTWPLWDVGDLGKAPKFKVDVRSRSKQTYSGTHPSTGCGMHVEWDEKWYKPQWSQGTGEVWPVRPGDDWPNLEFSLDAGGVAGNADGTDQQNAWGIKPTVGWHTIRIAIQLFGEARISVVSNPVKIFIVAPGGETANAAPAWGEPVEGVQCRLRTEKATWPLWDVRDFGKAPKFKVDIRSLAKEAVFRGSLWGYGVHVQWDGKWHKREWLGRVAGIAPPSLSVKPGDILRDLDFNLETRSVMVSPDGVAENPWRITPTAGEHTVRIAIQLRSGERRVSVVSNPVKIEIVPSAGEAAKAAPPWGQPADGVQCRLRPEKVTWPLWNAGDLGKAPKFKVDIRSRSKKTYWGSLPSSGCGVHVEWDGKWHEPQWENYDDPPWMVGPGVDLPDQEFSLDAGGAMISPQGTAQNTWGIKPTVGWHTIRIAIQLFGEARISVVSNPVKIFIVAPGGETANAAPAWGEPVEGVQCRLRPEKVAWPLWDVRDLGKAPKFKVDIRRAEQPFGYGMLVGNGVHVQWDGKWHNWQRARSPGKHLSVGPGNVLPGLRFSLGEGGLIGEPGRAAENVWGIKPTVGAHTVRIAIQLVDGRDLADGPPDISVVSNPVEIEIVAGEPGDAVFGPVIERPVTGDSSKAMRYLDLETGKYAAPQSDGVFATTGWLKKHGVDLQSGPYESGPTSRTAVDMMLRQLPDAVFGASHDWTADEARAKLNNLAGPQSVRVIGAPGIYAFRTREGSLGIMQLVAAPKNKSEVIVRYKLLKELGHLTVGAERPADTFAVYLVDQPAPDSVLHGDISKLRLAKRPILTLEDVLAVDAAGRVFLKEPARKLLFEGSGHAGEGSKPDSDLSPQELQQRRAIGRSGQRGTGHQDPFVLVLDGRRVQAGRIFCLVSSPMIRAIRYAPPGEPVMVCTAGEVDLEKDKKDKEAFLDVLRREGKVIEWGTAVRSVQCGLRADRVRWKANELPTLALGVRNLEPLIWKTHSLELELDGQWYQTTTDQALEPFPAPTSTKEFFHFRQEQDTQVCELRLLGDHWQRKDGTSGERSTMGKERPMRLTPGKHVVRVAVGARYHGGGRDEPLIRALSKPIEIEVVAEEAPGAADETAPDRRIIDGKTKIDETSWGKPVDGLQLGVSFVYGDRPYLAGERVDLKLTVRNNTTKTVELADFTPLVGWTPTISESDGKTKVFVNSPDVSFPVQTRRSKIAPGETWVVGGTSVILDPAPRFPAKQHNTTPRVKLAAGKYHISQTYRFGDLELTSGKLELTVVATKPADATEKYNADSRVTDTDSSESVPPPKFQPTISRTVSFDFFKNEAYFNRRCQVSIAAQFLGEDFLGCSVSSQFFTVF